MIGMQLLLLLIWLLKVASIILIVGFIAGFVPPVKMAVKWTIGGLYNAGQDMAVFIKGKLGGGNAKDSG